MKNLFHRGLLALLLALGTWLTAQATHVRGGEITYTSIAPTTPGVPRYHVLVTLYCDPANQYTLQTDVTIDARRGGCGSGVGFSVTIPRSGNTLPVGSGNCPPGQYYHFYTFETDLDLPAGQWTLSSTLENRIATIANIDNGNSVNRNLYLSTYLDNTLTSQDSSPRFESQVLPTLNAGNVTPASFSTYDSDADSLSYGYILPQEGVYSSGQLTGCGAPISTATIPPHYQLDPASGALLPTAGQQPQGIYNITAIVNEYRCFNGQWRLLGYVVRDLTYFAIAPGTAADTPPTFTALAVNGAAQPLAQAILARPGQTLNLDLTATDPDAGQHLRFVSSAPSVVPGLSLASPVAGQARVQWQVPATLPPGRYRLAVDVFDDACPNNLNTTATLTVVVTNQALAARASLNAEHEVYPVPFREQVQFRATPGQPVTLLDALGRPVAQLQAGPDGRVLWQPGEAVRPGLYIARGADGQAVARLLRE